MLSNMKLLTRNKFIDKVYEDENDVFVFVYTSSVEDNT